MLVSAEIYHMLKEKREYDRDGYIAALNRLPELPEELTDDGSGAA